MTTELFTTPGLIPWTCPSDVALLDIIEGIGGGGFGGATLAYGPGGGGGAYAKRLSVPVVPGQTYHIWVPNGTSSRHAIFYAADGSTILMKAAGGSPGGASSIDFTAAAGLGGLIADCVGDVLYRGGNGGLGGTSGGTTTWSGAGGGGASALGNGNDADNLGNEGAANGEGGRGGYARRNSGGSGLNGQAYGGAGSGRLGSIPGTVYGAGASGKVQLTYRPGESGSFNWLAGTSIVFEGTRIMPTEFAISSGTSVSFEGTGSTQFDITSGTSVSFEGVTRRDGDFDFDADTSLTFEGRSLQSTQFDFESDTSLTFEGQTLTATEFDFESGTELTFETASQFDFESGTELTFESASVAGSVFTFQSDSEFAFFSPIVTLATIQNGSPGEVGETSYIPWASCDYAKRITLGSGIGTYRIDHVEIIEGKSIRVSIYNLGALPGSRIEWDSGDAVVDWGVDGPPAIPAIGLWLYVEFFARSLDTVLGRKFWN